MSGYQFPRRKVGSIDFCGVRIDIASANVREVSAVARAVGDADRDAAVMSIVAHCATVDGQEVDAGSLPQDVAAAICTAAVTGKIDGGGNGQPDFQTPPPSGDGGGMD
jgi:hypothetical protein